MDTCFIPTRASLRRKNVEETHAVTVFEDYKRKSKGKSRNDETTNESSEPDPRAGPEFNIKKTKQEIIKFGMTGFDAATQEDAKIKLAIKLGAKPPKNKNKNYKKMLEDKKNEKVNKQEDLKFQQLGKNNAGRATAKGKSFDKKRKLKSDILDIYGTVKSKDLKSIQKHKNIGKHGRRH